MSKKAKHKAQKKKISGKGKALAKRTGAIESTLAKLLRLSDKIIARQKKAKRDGKRLSKDHRLSQRQLEGVETEVSEQLQRIRDLAEKNSALQERLKKQARITKDNCARLDVFEPSLADDQQRSQQLSHQITDLIQLTEKLTGRSDALGQGLASLEFRVGQHVEDQGLHVAAAGTLDSASDGQTGEQTLPLQILGFEASDAAAADRADEQGEWLEKLQARLDMLEDYCADLEEGNRKLVLSIDDLGDREQQRDEQNSRLIEQSQTLEAGQAEQQSKIEHQGQQIGGLSDQITDLRSRLDELTNDSEESRRWREQGTDLQRRLEQQLDGLQRNLGERQGQEFQSLTGLNDAMQQQLKEVGDREQSLRQQIDHLGGLLVTTEGKLTEQNAQLALEDTRLAELAQLLEQRLTDLEGTADERLTQELQSLRELSETMQRQLRETGDSEQSLRQQIDHLGGLLVTTEGKLTEQNTNLASEDARLAEQAQRLEQRFVDLEETVGKRLPQELQSLRGLSDAMQQQLQEAGDRQRSMRQRADDLEDLLASTGGKLATQNTNLTQKTAHLASGQQALKVRQNRLFGGLVTAGLLVLALSFGGYWLNSKRLAENQSVTSRQIDEIKQQIRPQERRLAEQQRPPESIAEGDEIRTQITLLESRLAVQEQLFETLEGQFTEGNRSTQGSLENLRQALAQQEQSISGRHDEMDRIQQALQQLGVAQQRTDQRLAAEQSLQRAASGQLQAAAPAAVKDLQGRPKVQATIPEPERPIDGLRDASWLHRLNPTHYTVQVVAAHNKAVIERVAANAGRAGELAYYKRQYQGRDWYVLLYGDFPTKAQALSATSGLSEKIKAFKPWIRRISWVHRELPDRP